VSHIPYTICRSSTYYYNRRVPIHAVNSYVRFIRQALSKDTLEAEALSKRLSNVLEGAWSATIDASPLNGDLFYKFLKHNWFLIELNELSHSFGLEIN